MRLIRGINNLAALGREVAATIGNFDGVHLGHQNLLQKLKETANRMRLPLVVILFEPQPGEYFQKEKAPPRLASLREKLDILQICQVDFVYCIPFNATLAQTSAIQFADHLFTLLKIKYLLVGEDFRFGRNREGDFNLLMACGAKQGCLVEAYLNFCINSCRVSSTQIRLALQQANLSAAADYLGRQYSFCARVVKGDGRGRQWGIPTANLLVRRFSLPLYGVYVVKAYINKQTVYGVANLGKRPTVCGVKNSVEVHLFDFNNSIYGELLQVFFLHKLRDEVTFTSIEALIAQIHKDIAAAKAFLNPMISSST